MKLTFAFENLNYVIDCYVKNILARLVEIS